MKAAESYKKNGISIVKRTKVLSMSPSRTLMSIDKLSNQSKDYLHFEQG